MNVKLQCTEHNICYISEQREWTISFVLQPVIAVRFCPVLFQPEQPSAGTTALPINLPYRMVFAIATRDSILVYDTQVIPTAYSIGTEPDIKLIQRFSILSTALYYRASYTAAAHTAVKHLTDEGISILSVGNFDKITVLLMRKLDVSSQRC